MLFEVIPQLQEKLCDLIKYYRLLLRLNITRVRVKADYIKQQIHPRASFTTKGVYGLRARET